MKIIFFCSSLGRGGAERVAVNLSEYFVSHGDDVSVITVKTDSEEYDVPSGVQRYNLDSGNKLIKIFELRKKLKELKYDLIITMGVPNSVYVIPATRGLNYKVIVSERNDPTRFAGKKSTMIISRILMKKADGCVFQTQIVKKLYEKMRITGCVIKNPLSKSIEKDMRKPALKGDVIAVGRLSPQKNYELLLRAFREVIAISPYEKLSIYGDGKQREELTELVKHLGLEENVRIRGNVKNVYDMELNAKLYVLTSSFEGIPNSLLEALAAGLPCVASDCRSGGCRELIESVDGGRVVRLEDKKDTIDAMIYYIKHPQNEVDANRQMKRTRELYSIDRIGYEWLEYINEVISGQKNFG